MEGKKWPLLAQFIIGLGLIGSVLGVIQGVKTPDFAKLAAGLMSLFIFWSFYKFKPWAHVAVTILLAIKILHTIQLIINGLPIMVGVTANIISVMIIYYFHTPAIKGFFHE